LKQDKKTSISYKNYIDWTITNSNSAIVKINSRNDLINLSEKLNPDLSGLFFQQEVFFIGPFQIYNYYHSSATFM
jgi:hypothetical protein